MIEQRLTITYDPGELDPLLETGIPIDLPADATDIDAVLARSGGLEGYDRDTLVVLYKVRHIAADEARTYPKKLMLNPQLGEQDLDRVYFPRHAVTPRTNGTAIKSP